MLKRMPFLVLCALSVFGSAAQLARAQQPSIVWQKPGGDAAVFSRDGSLLAAGDSLTVHLYRAADGAEVRNVKVRFGPTSAMDFSPNGALLAVGVQGFNQNLRVFRVSDGTQLFVGTHNNGVPSVAFSPNGALLASGGDDRKLVLRRTDTFAPFLTITTAGKRVTALAWSDDGSAIYAGNSLGQISVFSTSDGSLLGTLPGHTERISSLRFSHDGNTLVSSSFDGTIRLWSAAGTPLRTITVGGADQTSVTSVDFTADDARLIAGTSDIVGTTAASFVRGFRVSNGAPLFAFERSPAGSARFVSVSPLGATFTWGEGTTRIVARVP